MKFWFNFNFVATFQCTSYGLGKIIRKALGKIIRKGLLPKVDDLSDFFCKHVCLVNNIECHSGKKNKVEGTHPVEYSTDVIDRAFCFIHVEFLKQKG